MVIPGNKEELLNDIRSSYKKLISELSALTEQAAQKKELPGHAKGTAMSVNNLLAYLIGWGQLVQKWNARTEKNEPVDLPETGYKWNELGLLAQKFYADFRDDSYPSLCKKLHGVVLNILDLIERKSDAELYKKAFYKQYTLGRLIQLNTASPYKNATLRIRKWKKENNAGKPPGS